MNDRTAAGLVGLTDDGTPLLDEFGERLRVLRARRGMTRKDLARASKVSDRYLASLESGKANPSLLVLDQVARGLECSVAEVLGDMTTASPEWLLLRDLLKDRSEADIRMARVLASETIGVQVDHGSAVRRIALIGLRGAGKSTLGHLLAEDLDMPLIELSEHIERIAGYSIREIQDLYGTSAYRRYEYRALEEALQIYPEFVLAAPGGLVSEPTTFRLLLSSCWTVWLRAEPEDHMRRVARQGDLRPMAGNAEAMEDLRRILRVREAFYSKADVTVGTSGQTLDETFTMLRTTVRHRLGATA
jgi:XRE family aerobic/anaerobic benzoate catabolism transcriptional regulator